MNDNAWKAVVKILSDHLYFRYSREDQIIGKSASLPSVETMQASPTVKHIFEKEMRSQIKSLKENESLVCSYEWGEVYDPSTHAKVISEQISEGLAAILETLPKQCGKGESYILPSPTWVWFRRLADGSIEIGIKDLEYSWIFEVEDVVTFKK